MLFHQNCWSWVQFLVSWLLIIGGWYAVHKAALSRERRKEKREEIDKIIEEIRVIESMAIDFHNSKIFDKKINSNITLRIDRLSKKLQTPSIFNKIKIQTQLMIEFRKSITLHHFDKSDFPSLTQRIIKNNLYPATSIDTLIRDINSATDDLRDAVESAKYKIFP